MYREYVSRIKQNTGSMGCSASRQPLQNNGTPVSTTQPHAVKPASETRPAQGSTGTEVTPAPAAGNATGAKKQLSEEDKEKYKTFLDAQKKLADELEKKILDTMSMLKNLDPVDTKTDVTTNALAGNIEMECPSPAKIVRIFTSSTFTDSKQERNNLMKFAYPKIKEHCRKIGYEFQVVDMRWGIRDEAVDDHTTTELCLKELKLCQKLSTGPSFVSLISHKYGYTPFPRVIEADEYESLLANMRDVESKELLQKWFRRDDNAVPASYILSPISTHIPEFLSLDDEKKKVAKQQWWKESDQMQEALGQTAKEVFDVEMARKYIMSVTETETEEGLRHNKAKNFLWVNRNIEDIEQQESSYALSRYMECLGPEEKVQKSRQLLKELKEDKLKRKLDPDKILSYSVNWSGNGGIDPEGVDQHKQYLERMCNDFVSSMVAMIDKSVAEKKQIHDPVIEECVQHIRFCQSKCEGFSGQTETLEKLKDYVTASKQLSPFVLHGTSGTGKTSIMAWAAKMTKTWLNNRPHVLVVRFLGTTPESSNLMSVLYGICQQIRRAYKLPRTPRLQNITLQVQDFKQLLLKSRANQPLVLFLDSLDQLDPAYDARQMTWLFRRLVPTTRVVVSTLPEPIYGCFPALQSVIPETEYFHQVPVLEKDDVGTILQNWLKMRERKLTANQMEIVMKAFEKCPTPLFLKLSFEESANWTSFHPIEKTILHNSVRSSIDHLFQNLEKIHGKMLVSRALAYLSLTHNGASEAELEDILSCDDDVLNDVYMYWTPPMRRLPPLLIVRIRNDLNQYLVERGFGGIRVLYWYHRQFIEAAEARYCSDSQLNIIIHQNLADFFNGTWANGRKKPYTTRKGEHLEEDRHVSAQPLMFGENDYNLRSLINLPYHRIKAGQEKELEEQCLANVHFLLCKLAATASLDTLDDFVAARERFPDNRKLTMIHDALLLSQKGLITDHGQLVPQLLGRLVENDITRDFLKNLREYPRPYLEPTKCDLSKPGGQLVHCISAHNTDIDMMDMTRDGKYVVTVCQSNKEARLWDIEAGKLKREIVGKGQCTQARFCNNDNWLVFEKDKIVVIEEALTGTKCFDIALASRIQATSIAVAGKLKTFFFACSKQSVVMYDLTKKGEIVSTFLNPENMKFGVSSNPYGTENYLALCDDDQYFITVLDLKAGTFVKKFRGFEPIPDDDGDLTEHEVEMLAIHPDETKLLYTTMFTSEVVLADFEGNKLRSVPADEKRSFRYLDFTPDGRHFYVTNSQDVLIFETETMKEIDYLQHTKDVNAAMTVDLKTIVTIADDSNLRIWDITKAKQTASANEIGELTQIPFIKKCWQLPSSRYMLIVGTMEKNGADKIFGVYDFIKDEYVRKRAMIGLEQSIVAIVDEKRIVLELNRKLLVFNLDTMSVETTLQGHVSAYLSDVFCTKRNELVCWSKSKRNLKAYDLDTGKVKYILKAGQTQKIDTVEVNEEGTIAGAKTDEGPLLLFDLVNRTLLSSIEWKPNNYNEYFASYMHASTDGLKFLFSNESKLPGYPQGADVEYMVGWDLQNREEIYRMHDAMYEKKHKFQNNDESTSVDGVQKLDNDRIISCHFDNIIRVFDINTGKLLGRLIGHTTSVKVAINENSPYILSYGMFDEEDCIRIWDKTTYKQIATYSLDKTVNDIHWSKCGRFFYTTVSSSHQALINIWHIKNGDTYVTNVNLAQIPETYSSKAEYEPMKIDVPEYDHKTFVPEEGDPDTDPEIITDESDIDDDDD